MIATLRTRLADSLGALASVSRNPSLRRLQLALAGSSTAQWAYGVAIAVYSYDAGGTTLVGVALFLRFIPAAIAAPFAGVLADRYPRERVMIASDLSRAVVLSGAAVAVLLDAPPALVITLTAIFSLLATAFEPAERALLPQIARSPEELTAANVASSTIESVAIFGGPAIGGLLLAVTSVEVVFAATVAGLLWSAALVSGISAGGRGRGEADSHERFLLRATAGFRAITNEPSLRLLIGLFSAQTMVSGALNVLIVVVALELLDWGDSGVGFLISAVGVGGLVGAIATLMLTGGHRLASGFVVGLWLWGLPIALLAAWPEPAVAVVLLGLVGLGNTIVDVSAYTLLQRAVPDEVLARVFGVLESLIIGSIALGSLVTPLLISGLGVRGALIATGALLPLLAVLYWRRLREMDAAAIPPERQLALLRASPIFSPLPAPVLERLAASLVPVRVARGQAVLRQGERGDRFYLVANGEVEVLVDDRLVRTQGRGDHFGEIALLRDVPRTATIRARTDVELYALERDDFIGAVTGHAESADAADAAVATRLAHARPRVASV